MSNPQFATPAEERAAFFHTLLGDSLPDGLWAHVWHVAPKHTDWERTGYDAEASATRNGRHDVYMSVGLAGTKGTHTERLRQVDAAGLFGVIADIDVAHDAHKHDALPKTDAEALDFIDSLEIKPTMVINSGHGFHVWWLFKEPWRFTDDNDQRRGMQATTAWQNHINLMAAFRGWQFDNVSDLSRVLRVPGTYNAKNRNAVVDVNMVRHSPNARYTPEELIALCQGEPLPTGQPGNGSTHGAVKDGQRFKQGNPCPICNGYEELQSGRGKRCWGFMGQRALTAYCTREEYAGELEPQITTIGSTVYRHELWGDCPCGVAHATAPQGDGPKEGETYWSVQFYLRMYHNRLRYVHTSGTWYENNERWWEPDQGEIAKRLGLEAVNTLYQQAVDETDHVRKSQLAQLAIRMDKADKIASMITWARTYAPISATVDQFDQEDWHVVAANGIIDLRTGKLLPHDPMAMHSKHLGGKESIEYDPLAQCPNWLAFLRKVFPVADGAEMIAYLQRVAGYTLTGSTGEQCIFICTGEGENGKTTLTEPIVAVLGTYYQELNTDTLMASKDDKIPADIAKLVGARGVFASENERNKALAEALVKKLTGSENVAARFMHRDFFTYKPKFKIWLHTNHKPRIRGTERGMWRRLRAIPFNDTFKSEEKVTDYYEKFLRPELPGILAWMVQGCLEWQRIGLAEPERVQAAWRDYRKESDTLADYLEDNVGKGSDQIFLAIGTAYRHYLKWCQLKHEPPESKTALSKAIAKQFNAEQASKGGKERGFFGLYLNDSTV